MLLVQTTYPLEGYESFIQNILKTNYVSCVQSYRVSSIYFWENKWEEEWEMLISFKTRKKFFKQIKQEILKNHTYKTPQIIALKVKKVEKGYKKWHNKTLKALMKP
ncbi:divalent cation tolerance protein CutA [Helicobacter burdigaliensis]|uniref:divalent cation tolerance protein CutA n=1 Tax=Helicobacter burdigaliensis TaxID=2315334 RepID=UPI000EF73B08|nr:divalent cation tolerance protein CutA [Helicobacter burdigaliensis]